MFIFISRSGYMLKSDEVLGRSAREKNFIYFIISLKNNVLEDLQTNYSPKLSCQVLKMWSSVESLKREIKNPNNTHYLR